MAELFSNNARSTFASGIGAGELTVTVQAGMGLGQIGRNAVAGVRVSF